MSTKAGAERISSFVYIAFGVAVFLVIVATTRLFMADLAGVALYGYAAIGVCGFGIALRAQDRLTHMERRLRLIEEKR